MAKITATKTVYWNDGNTVKSGKVKQIMSGHAVVKASTGEEYIVDLSRLSLSKPMTKSASTSSKTIIS